MAVMKWHSELDIFRKIKPCIVLEGNILDRFHYSGEPAHRTRDLSEYVLRMFRDAGYETVVFYDETHGFYGEDFSEDIEQLGALTNQKVTNGRIVCPFIAGNAGPSIGSMLSSCLGQCERATAVIMDMASRYIVSPDDIQMGEVRAFKDIMQAVRKAQFVDVRGGYTQNVLVMLVNKINDLPTWFYLNNPDVRPIHVQTPDSDARMEFVSDGNLEAFFAHEVWSADEAEADLPKLQKLQKQFVGMTEGFTYSDLVGMRTLCRNEKYHLSELPNVVEFYRYGVRENKWNKIGREAIQDLEKNLRSRVLGQEQAIDKVMAVIKRSAMQKGGNRPRGILFFAGPTGTGKTETAKALAESIFGDESCCIRFDMSEYRQDHSDQKLLGAPPGYVGYEAGGQLTNAVRDNPFSILLFDEIEKAHPSILDKFLQILDDGRLTDGQGKTVYFSESIIIFTSNKGIIEEVEERDEFGFPRLKNKQVVNLTDPPDVVREKVVNGIKNYLKFTLGRPELLNRIGENNIVVYDFIREQAAENILKMQIAGCCRMIENDLDISVDAESVFEDLLDTMKRSNVLENGGRGIRDMVETMLSTPLFEYICDNAVGAKSNIRVTEVKRDDGGKIVLSAEVN